MSSQAGLTEPDWSLRSLREPRYALEHLYKAHEELLYQLTAAVGHEDRNEREQITRSSEQLRRELVHRLLVEAHVDPAELDLLGYDLDAWHLGVIATSVKAAHALEELRTGLGYELLSVSHGNHVWAWFGGSRQIKTAVLKRLLSSSKHRDVSFAIGEAGMGIQGWRLTHHQAREAHRVAIYRPQRFTWYADSPLLSAALRDATLARSLKQKYLVPLRNQKDGGAMLRETLRAYIDADCSASSAKSTVGVGRHAVADRVRTVEQLIGQAIRTCLPELDLALRLEEFEEHCARQYAVRSSD